MANRGKFQKIFDLLTWKIMLNKGKIIKFIHQFKSFTVNIIYAKNPKNQMKAT